MVGRQILLGCLLIVLLFLSTEGRKRKRASLRGSMINGKTIMLADDPLLSVTSVAPSTKIGQCNCKCCEQPPAPYVAPPCMNDVIVAVDSSACFRDHHRRMSQFLTKLVNQFHKSGGDGQFGVDKTRLAIMQFSSDIENPLPLDDFDNYQNPSSSKLLRQSINDRISTLGFLGEGAFLNKALNATVREFLARRRPEEILRRRGSPRKVVIMLTNGKSHPDVTEEDIGYSVSFLRQNNITVLPVSVTRPCFGVSSPDWDDGLCPDEYILKKLSELSSYKDDDFLVMRASGTVDAVVNEATNCHFTPPPAPLKDYCNNCTCSCELPIGPRGYKGDKGSKGDSIKGDIGPKGDKGNKGEIGYNGTKGEVGEKGEKGIKGDIGPKGDKGVIGPKGDKGEIGEKGVIGDKGDKGEIGPKGEVGEKGDKGNKGIIGPKGNTGEKGQKGQKGEFGEKGDLGPKGTKGTKGIGVKGDKGEFGEKGFKGDDGEKGMIGPKGPKGMIGLCGKPGPAGSKGEPGLPGVDGTDGLAGPPGRQGPRGAEGNQGEKGDRGVPGEDGSQGRIGPPGLPGVRGPQGEPGERGFDGADSIIPGPRGPQGLVGAKGNRGESGTDGLDGLQGPPGEQGPRGFVGPKGEEGNLNIEALRPMIVEIIRELLPGDCEPTDGEPTPPPDNGYSTCADSQADVAFLIDGSSSVGTEDFKLLRRFLYDFVASFEFIGPDGFRVSVIQYNENPRVELSFEDSVDQVTVLNTIDNLQFVTGNTQTGHALDKAGGLFNSIRESGRRPGVIQVAVVITDGRSQDDVAEPAFALKESGVVIFAVGVTDSSEYAELVEIASAPAQDHIYTVETYGKIDTIKESLLQKICSAVRGSYRAPDDEDRPDEGSAFEEETLNLLAT